MTSPIGHLVADINRIGHEVLRDVDAIRLLIIADMIAGGPAEMLGRAAEREEED